MELPGDTMQDRDRLTLEKLFSACLRDKSLLKEAQTLLHNISTIDSTDTLFWGFFVIAVVKEPNETQALAQLGNDFAKFLVEKGLSISDRQPESSEGTVLHLSASAGNVPMTKFLVEEKKADLFAINDDDDKETPLDRAKKELEDPDTVDIQTIEGLKTVITYLEQKQLLVTNRTSLIPPDSPILAERRPTPPPRTPSPTDHSPTNSSSPENDRTEKMKHK